MCLSTALEIEYHWSFSSRPSPCPSDCLDPIPSAANVRHVICVDSSGMEVDVANCHALPSSYQHPSALHWQLLPCPALPWDMCNSTQMDPEGVRTPAQLLSLALPGPYPVPEADPDCPRTCAEYPMDSVYPDPNIDVLRVQLSCWDERVALLHARDGKRSIGYVDRQLCRISSMGESEVVCPPRPCR